MKEITFNSPDGAKFFGWDEEKTHQYVVGKPIQVGDPVLVVNSSGANRVYVLAEVLAFRRGRPNRLLVGAANGQVTHLFTFFGLCWDRDFRDPNLRMIPPVPEIMSLIDADTQVVVSKIP